MTTDNKKYRICFNQVQITAVADGLNAAPSYTPAIIFIYDFAKWRTSYKYNFKYICGIVEHLNWYLPKCSSAWYTFFNLSDHRIYRSQKSVCTLFNKHVSYNESSFMHTYSQYVIQIKGFFFFFLAYFGMQPLVSIKRKPE